MKNTVILKLDPSESELVLEYGYPAEDVIKIAKKSLTTGKMCKSKISSTSLDFLIGELSYNANRQEDYYLAEALDALCCRLEEL